MPSPALSTTYRGRFAPTPSGPLHRGSLLTALASWLDARTLRGRWLIRIDDLDHARCPRGAESQILRQLEAHGLTWDETPRRQSQHLDEYEAALSALRAQGQIFECSCTRAKLARSSYEGVDGPVYPGSCRQGPQRSGPCSLRFRVDPGEIRLEDAIQGQISRNNETGIGDFIVRRSDDVFGYHLACVVDEQAQRITDIVRGADLLGSTLCQKLLQRALGYHEPGYAHLPVLVDESGRKLSKQNHALPIDALKAAENLFESLVLLGQMPPATLERASGGEILDWGRRHWDRSRLPGQPSLALPTRMSYT
jgi:glutamyl-Q tRNA(Asp) synthetase